MSNNNNVTVSQLEQYKLEKKLKFEREKAAEEDLRKENEIAAIAVAKEQAERKAEHLASIARIQFRLPDGSSQTQYFPAESPLSELYTFVRNGLTNKYSDFSLYNTTSKLNLDTQDMEASLKDLKLVPSATVIILPLTAVSPKQENWKSFLMWVILTPFSVLWANINGTFRTTSEESSQEYQDSIGSEKHRRIRIHVGPKIQRKPNVIEQSLLCLIVVFFIYISIMILRWVDYAP